MWLMRLKWWLQESLSIFYPYLNNRSMKNLFVYRYFYSILSTLILILTLCLPKGNCYLSAYHSSVKHNILLHFKVSVFSIITSMEQSQSLVLEMRWYITEHDFHIAVSGIEEIEVMITRVVLCYPYLILPISDLTHIWFWKDNPVFSSTSHIHNIGLS